MTKEYDTIIYITKYWQTKGIIKTKASVDSIRTIASVRGWGLGNDYYHKNDFFLSEDEAQRFIREKAKKAIVTAKKKLLELEKIATNGVKVVPCETV